MRRSIKPGVVSKFSFWSKGSQSSSCQSTKIFLYTSIVLEKMERRECHSLNDGVFFVMNVKKFVEVCTHTYIIQYQLQYDHVLAHHIPLRPPTFPLFLDETESIESGIKAKI